MTVSRVTLTVVIYTWLLGHFSPCSIRALTPCKNPLEVVPGVARIFLKLRLTHHFCQEPIPKYTPDTAEQQLQDMGFLAHPKSPTGITGILTGDVPQLPSTVSEALVAFPNPSKAG